MDHPEITGVKDAIYNPANARHYMKLKPVNRRVRITHGDVVLAETTRAVRLMEVGHDLYDPPLYVPFENTTGLVAVPEKTTHCPLKGDASYFAMSKADAAEGKYIAWAYPEPFDFADAIAGLVAFDAAKVRIEEIGDGSA